MALSNHLAQGGQTFLHKVRMLRQVLGLAFRIGLIVGLVVFGALVVRNIPSYVYTHVWKLVDAKARVFIFGDQHQMKNEDGGLIYAKDRATHPGYLHNATVFLPNQLKHAGFYGLLSLMGVMGLAFLHWSLKGRRDKQQRHLSGSKLVSVKELARQLKKERKASDLTLGDLPLVKDSETQHMLITGTTGSGKTNCFHHLLPQIREKGQRAVVVDTTGEFVARYYREGKDILLNPLDRRSNAWHPWVECTETYHYDELASNFIPQTGQDPFWSTAARTIFSEALQHLSHQNNRSIDGLLELLIRSPLAVLSTALKDTKAASLVDPASDKTAASIRATLASSIHSLSYLKPIASSFSIRNWVQSDNIEDDRWVFLSMLPEQRQALRPVISAWTGTAIKSLLGRSPNTHNKLWICIDELPSLHKLEELALCLAEGRKYGAAVLLGLQNTPQLETLYGRQVTKTLLDLCSTKVMFRSASYEMAEAISASLGEQEMMEVHEGISYGANDIRDGVNLSLQKRMRPIIHPNELVDLKNLDAYVRLPQYAYVTKISLPYQQPPMIAESFVHRDRVESLS